MIRRFRMISPPKSPRIIHFMGESLARPVSSLFTSPVPWICWKATLFGFAGLPGSCSGLRLMPFLRGYFTTSRNLLQTLRIQSLRVHLGPQSRSDFRSGRLTNGSALGAGPTGPCLGGGRRGTDLGLSVNEQSIGRGREMAGLGATIAGIALALSIASPVAAKSKRAVVLLDFSQPTPPPTVSDPVPQTSVELSAVSRAMASQFTGAPMDRAYWAPGVVLPTAGLGLRTLGNPFLAYAVATHPITPLFDTTTTLAHDACAASRYQPSFSFGRAAEDRRRTIFPLDIRRPASSVFRSGCSMH